MSPSMASMYLLMLECHNGWLAFFPCTNGRGNGRFVVRRGFGHQRLHFGNARAEPRLLCLIDQEIDRALLSDLISIPIS
jgi:hypothetical protein